MWKDILFLLTLVFLGYLSYRVFFKPIKNALNKLKVENFQSQYIFDSSPRTLDSQERQFDSDFDRNYLSTHPEIKFEKLNMLSPNLAQYGKSKPTYIYSSNSIPDAALPSMSLKDPWSKSEVIAAEVPENGTCETSATGLFITCGAKSYNSACELSKKF